MGSLPEETKSRKKRAWNGIKRWTPEEDHVVRDLYLSRTRAQIATVLGRTEGMVRSRCWTLGLNNKPRPAYTTWTARDLAILRAAYNNVTGPVNQKTLMKKLGRSRASITCEARRLGLTNAKRAKHAQLDLNLPRYASPEDHSKKVSVRVKRWIAEHGHPRGALGMKHTDAVKLAQSKLSKAMWDDPSSKINAPELAQIRSDNTLRLIAAGKMRNGFTRCKGGVREDIGPMRFRSAWEANYARVLKAMVARGEIVGWEYECKLFVFERIKRGMRAYLPDFKVTYPDGHHEWHEVKGWMDPGSVERLKRMAEFFPQERVVVVGEDWFRAAHRSGLAASIPGWEWPKNQKRAA